MVTPCTCYTVGMTDVQPFYRKIDNSIIHYWISAKIGMEMCFNKLFICITFQLNWSMHLHFMAENAVCKLKKQRNFSKILLACVSELAGVICFKFGIKIPGISAANMI